MVRDYTRANRPAGVEAYDLRAADGSARRAGGASTTAIREAAAARRAALFGGGSLPDEI